MELAFESKELRAVCEQGAAAKEELGEEMANDLRRRLADLRAATAVGDLLAGNPKVVESDGMSYLVVELCQDYEIVLKANHPENPVTDTGQLDWAKVSRIKVTYIGGKDER